MASRRRKKSTGEFQAQVLRIANGTPKDLKALGAPKGDEAVAKKPRKRKEPVYTGDDPVKKAYYARKGTMQVRTGRKVVPVAKLAEGAKGKISKTKVVPGAQPAHGSKSILTRGRIG
jgi:hypothetical protein